MVGPLSVRDGGPLPPHLEEFVRNSGDHGFIIVSFGSNVASILPRKVVDMLATAFGKLKQKVVWRLKGISVIKSSNQSAASFPGSVFFPPGKTVDVAALERSPMNGLPFESTIEQTTETMPPSHKTIAAAAMRPN